MGQEARKHPVLESYQLARIEDHCGGLGMTTLQELLKQWEARSKDALPTDAMLINKHIRELRTALAQHREQQPVCHGCGIPAGDVHMSTCKSGKWPSRVSNGDTAAPAPQTPFNEPDAAMWLTKNKLAQHDLLSAPQPNIQNQIVKDISKKPCHK